MSLRQVENSAKPIFLLQSEQYIGVKKPQAATQWAMLQGQCISSEIAIPENGWVKSHLVKPPGLLKFLLGTEQNFCITANF